MSLIENSYSNFFEITNDHINQLRLKHRIRVVQVGVGVLGGDVEGGKKEGDGVWEKLERVF